jgi:hypothetical protein
MDREAAVNKEVTKTVKHLKALTKLLLRSGDERPPQHVVDQVLVPACLLTKILAPDVRQKLDEYLFAAQNSSYRVNTNQHGADLIDKDTGSSTELKVSTCIVNPPARHNKHGKFVKPVPKASVMWPMPKYDSKGDQKARRKKVLESMRAKTDSGGAIIRVVNGMQALLKEYHLSHAFLMGYFKRADLGTSTAYNMGCPLCKHCNSFHRLDRFQKYSDRMDKEKGELTEEEWKEVFTRNGVCPMKVKDARKSKKTPATAQKKQ